MLTATPNHELKNHWPGEPALWSMLCCDMTLFAIMFIVYVVARYNNLATFQSSHAAMDESLGLVNTLLLLASSWFIAAAVQCARMNHMRFTRWLILGGLLCAVGFVIVKYFEYSEKLYAGITLNTNLFFVYYFSLTGIHLLHVLIAIVVMSFAGMRCRKPALDVDDFVFLESAASFWHLVDILWIMLFALLYLIW
jgi:nitric oxide reductase NorE protein